MKRTYQPSKIVRKRRHGFRSRMATVGGRKVIASRRSKGRKRLSAQIPVPAMPMLRVLKQRADFLAAAKSGFKFVKPSIVVQARKRAEGEMHPLSIRMGFTATKALGNAVVRARVKRRLRAAAAKLVAELGIAGCDYVFIGREACYKGTFDDLIRDMKHALKRLADQMTAPSPTE